LNSSALSAMLFFPFSWFMSPFLSSNIVYDYTKGGTVRFMLDGVGTLFLLADVPFSESEDNPKATWMLFISYIKESSHKFLKTVNWNK
jgi:hypothetical protein